ncbi:MAG: hypothetical protein N3E39_00515 [Candidatus Methanomethylicia archaeon]|nr:hypothetical protein [Candidatus Methanomethylicia archaeon]
MSLNEFKELINESKTIYVYGISYDGTPYIIVYSDKRFKPYVKSEGYVKIVKKIPLILIDIALTQHRLSENIKIAILPIDQDLRRFVNTIGEIGEILISLINIEEFKEVYKSIVEKGYIEEKKYNAITFKIPVDNYGEIRDLMEVIDIIDKEFIKRIEETIVEKQKKEINEIGLELRW